MTTTALRQPLHMLAADGTPRRRPFALLLGGLRRRKPTLFQKCLAVHMANAREQGRLR